MTFTQPATLQEITQSIGALLGQADRRQVNEIAADIVYGVTYGNNQVDVEVF